MLTATAHSNDPIRHLDIMKLPRLERVAILPFGDDFWCGISCPGLIPLGAVRPQDLAGIYAQPRPEIARLVDRGVLHRVAHGYYVIVAPEQVGRPWLPALESVAAGIATSIYGQDQAIVMGISAARVLGAEQTVLDLARRPELGNAEAEVRPAIETLYRRSDPVRLAQLAADQRLGAALRRAQGWVGA